MEPKFGPGDLVVSVDDMVWEVVRVDSTPYHIGQHIYTIQGNGKNIACYENFLGRKVSPGDMVKGEKKPKFEVGDWVRVIRPDGEGNLEKVKRIEPKTLAERVEAEGRTSSISMGCSTEGQIPASEYRRILGIPKDFASDEEISKVLDNKSDKKICGESPVSKVLRETNFYEKATVLRRKLLDENSGNNTVENTVRDLHKLSQVATEMNAEAAKKFGIYSEMPVGPLKTPITTWTFRLKFPNGDEVEVPEPPKDQWRLDETITCDWPHRYIKEIYACMENYVRDVDIIEEQAKCWWHDYADRAWEENAQVLWKKIWKKVPEKKPEPEKPVWEFL